MIGVDIGGTNLLVGVIEHNKVVSRSHRLIEDRSFQSVVNLTCETILDVYGASPDSVGIAVAGGVDADNGIVVRAQNLNWDQAPLAKEVSDKLGCNVVIENDVNAAAWGEFNFGAGKSLDSMFAVWIGTGIGGGLILDNKLWRGPLGTGGEFGMSISEQNPDLETRVLEGFASKSGFQRITSNRSLTTEDIVHGFQNDDAIKKMIQSGSSRIGTSIANVITLLSLETVVLGGGLIEALGKPLIDGIRTQFDKDVFPTQLRVCKFKTTELGPDAGLLGASLLATQ